MSGSWPQSSEGHLAEQHLGDRLAALVDGELGHDARERVLAHVATCAKCKGEVDAQRRLKSAFAQAAPPLPSESFLARLQGLPAGGDPGNGGSPSAGGVLPGGTSGRFGSSGLFGHRRERFEFAYTPVRRHEPAPAAAAHGPGLGVDDVGRHETDRPAWRGLRFAFAAAGAVSLAAIALGGVAATGTPDAEARAGSAKGNNVTPLRTHATGAAATSESRRRAAGPLLGQGTRGDTPVAPVGVSAPLLPGLRPPAQGGATAVSPLIRPPESAPPPVLTAWAMSTGFRTSGFVTPMPTSTSR